MTEWEPTPRPKVLPKGTPKAPKTEVKTPRSPRLLWTLTPEELDELDGRVDAALKEQNETRKTGV